MGRREDFFPQSGKVGYIIQHPALEGWGCWKQSAAYIFLEFSIDLGLGCCPMHSCDNLPVLPVTVTAGGSLPQEKHTSLPFQNVLGG